MRAIFLYSLLIIFISTNRLCNFRTNMGMIDLNLASYSKDQRIRISREHDMEFNICLEVKESCRGHKLPSLLTIWDEPEKCFAGGRSETFNDISIKLIDPNNAKSGVVLRYNNGDTFEQDGKLLEANTMFTIKCNLNLTENTKPIREDSVIEGNKIVYKIKFESRYACPNITMVEEFCVINTNKGLIDLKKASFPIDQKVTGQGVSDFEINICKNVTRILCKGREKFTPSLWHLWNDPTACYAAGRINKKDDYQIKLLRPDDPFGGVTLTYRNGDVFDQGLGGVLEANTMITIECDPSTENTKPELDGHEMVGNVVTYKFKFKSKHACPKINIK